MDKQDVRLIDANSLEDELNRWLDENPVLYDYGDDGFDYGKISGVDFCIEKLQKAPTIDPDSMRPRGRRLNPSECGGNMFGPCSICGAWYDVMQGTDDGLFLYCPHCGAKMKE